MSVAQFYDKMRAGGVAKTAAVNAEAFAEMFEEEALKEGKDVLYLGFSSGLSTTYNSGRIAALDLMVYLTVEQKKNGATIEEAEAFARDLIGRMGIWFTVDDLVYLKRGGRVSPTAAFVGNLLGIKPVLYMDNEGHLIPVSKVRGRRTSIVAMADKYTEKAVDKENGTVFISHGDCLDDAKAR